MERETSIREIVLGALDELNARREASARLPRRLEAPLYGAGGPLDSLELVNLVVLVEERLNDSLGVSVTLADERAVSQQRSPFRSGQSLVEYIARLLAEQAE